MTTFVFVIVLFAALCHASWNALIKVALDPLSTTTLILCGATVFAIAAIPFVPLPAAPSWPYLVASSFIHLLYFGSLAEAYRTGDLGQVYPIARGSAPLMTAAVTTFVVGEKLSAAGWAGIVALVAGVFLLSAHGGRELARFDRRAICFALLTAVMICGYSVVDGIGARASLNPAAYGVWLFLGNALLLTAYALYRDGGAVVVAVRGFWGRGLIGGALQVLSYGTVLWAMTRAPIAIVATLRETSVLFGALIAVMLLKEPLRAARIVAALLIVAGLALIRFH
jgi:drug/metabolite transporter (DMT)-like permease